MSRSTANSPSATSASRTLARHPTSGWAPATSSRPRAERVAGGRLRRARGRVAVHASGGESGALRVAVADRRRGVRERLELGLARPERGVQRRPDGCRLRRRDLGRIEAARVLYGPVGVEEGVVAAVAEAETE